MNAEERDETIHREIQAEMECLLGSEQGTVAVLIAVKGGVVTLSGHVSNPSERQLAEQIARRVLGVRSVANEIHLHRPLNDAELDASLLRAVVDAFDRKQENLD